MDACLPQLQSAEPATPLERVERLCLLIGTYSAKLNTSEQAPARLRLQAALCQTLLQVIDANTAMGVTAGKMPSQHCSSPPSPEYLADQGLRTACSDAHACTSGANKSTNLHTISNPTDVTPASDTTRNFNHATASQAAHHAAAEVWTIAAPILQQIYTWEEEEIVTSVIDFWSQVSDLLHGSWVHETLLQDSSNSKDGVPGQLPAYQQEQQHYIQWLCNLQYSAFSAVLQQLYDFYCLTGISPLQHKKRTPLSSLLLLFLQLQPGTNPTNTPPPVHQLLQLMQWPHIGSNGSNTASSTSTALAANEAFEGVCRLLQYVSIIVSYTAPCTHEADVPKPLYSPTISTQKLAQSATAFLQSAYGWVPLGMPAAGSSYSCCSSSRRPEDTLYDCFMLQLLLEMFKGASHATQSPQQQAAVHVDQHGHTQGGSSLIPFANGLQQQQYWQEWCESEQFSALSALVREYDKPHVLVRGLVALVLQQQLQNDGQLAEQAGGDRHKSNGTQSRMDKRTVNKVMQFLEHVFLQHPPDLPAAEAATAVNRLLQGCAELLRPAANCAVDWRCAALNLMTSAVEDFVEEHPDDGVLQSCLWSIEALEGLFYCLNHDPSIKVRRAAMKLLQLVVLPHGSGLAVQLVRTLAAKVCDKDSIIQEIALELLVQLDATMICDSLTIAQWSGVVQAGLELCHAGGEATDEAVAGTSAGRDRGRQNRKGSSQGVCQTGQQQLMQLFRKVLKAEDTGAAGERQGMRLLHGMQGHDIRRWVTGNAHKVVGSGGCSIILLLILQNSELEGLCSAVAASS